MTISEKKMQIVIDNYFKSECDVNTSIRQAFEKGFRIGIKKLPSAQPERTEYIPDTKAVRSKRDCVDLAERVTATFYDQEHEEWTQQTVTIADVLDSVCDEYTVLPSAQPEPFVDADKLKRCRFEYINACKIVAHPTPDTSKSDIYDAHAVIKALHPIFGDVEF